MWLSMGQIGGTRIHQSSRKCCFSTIGVVCKREIEHGSSMKLSNCHIQLDVWQVWVVCYLPHLNVPTVPSSPSFQC